MRIIAISLLTFALLATSATAATTSYAVSPAYEATVDNLTTAVALCIKNNDYSGPFTIASISLVDDVASVHVFLGPSGDAASTLIMRKVGTIWTCAGGTGGVVTTQTLTQAKIPASLHAALLTGKGAKSLLRKRIAVPAPHAIFGTPIQH